MTDHILAAITHDEIREELLVTFARLHSLAQGYGHETSKGRQLTAAAGHVIATAAETADGIERTSDIPHRGKET